MKVGRMVAFIFTALFVYAVSAAAQEFKPIENIPLKTLFAYDKNIPLNVEKKKLRESPTTITYSVYYDSVHDKRVPAILTIPKKPGSYPVVIFMHGHGMKKDLGPMADTLIGQKGYAYFAIDAMYRNERSREGFDFVSPHLNASRDGIIQTIIDNMRGIDYLETEPSIDTSRMGVMGLSMGSFIGSVFFSLDHRIRVGAFGVGGADWMKVGRRSFFGPLYQLKQSGLSVDDLLAAYGPIDPLNYVADTKGRPVLMMNGRLDELVPAEAATALYKGLGEPKSIQWFDGGHVPSMDVIMTLVQNMFDFYNKYLKPKTYYKVSKEENVPPVLTDFEIKPEDEMRQNAKVKLNAKASDKNNDIIFVKAYFDSGDDAAILYDDGESGGDEKAGDGVFTGRHTLYEKAKLGKSNVHVVAVDRWGETSAEIISEIDVLPIKYPAGEHAPKITAVSLPASAKIGEKVKFEIKAEDADGNLSQVLVSITEMGLTLAMPVGKNGVISQDFDIPDVIPPGVYHFTFQAKDKAKMYSEIVEKTSEIQPAPAKAAKKKISDKKDEKKK